MNLSNEIIGGSLLIIIICITLLMRYAFAWYADIRDMRMRLTKVEEEIRQHSQTCPVKHQVEALVRPRPTLADSSTPKSVDMVRHYIQLYHPDFLELLTRNSSEKLTGSDELLCMMIKLEYPNKEIASILSITPNSVITARYRLKRKLGLTQNHQLDAWIQSIGKTE
ncbi:helix-turn-helix transcriptional regulator [Bacteroides timonensis]|uniref:helix-turn-helix transcriptional regulator n=1 Tax=Bacteroides timonensis TaxID=1470345 RepID=UPI000F78114E|nr:hypothetical protein [Bacteroides timonensis]